MPMISLFLVLISQTPSVEVGARPIVLIVERIGPGLQYTCNEKRLDPKRVLGGVENLLLRDGGSGTPLRILYGEGVPIQEPWLMASLFEGKAGLKDVRHFSFSRKTGVMVEFWMASERLRLTFDGKIEKKPW